MKCPDCHGAGHILLFSSTEMCSTCDGEGHLTAPAELSSSGGLENSFSIETSSCGEQLFLGTGKNQFLGGIPWTTNVAIAPTTFDWKNPENTSRAFLTIDFSSDTGSDLPSSFNILGVGKSPTQDGGVEAPMGSVAIAPGGSLWLKCGPSNDAWERVLTEKTSAEKTRAPEGSSYLYESRTPSKGEAETLEKVTGFVVEALAQFYQSEKEDDLLMGSTHHAVGVLSHYVFADMLGDLRQNGEEELSFVASARDFADIYKFTMEQGRGRDGTHMTMFGVPCRYSRKIEVGHLGLVSKTGKVVLCLITR